MNARTEPKLSFDASTGVIDIYLNGNWIYDIDLNDFRDPVQALDWIRQVSQKTWASTETISDLCNFALAVLNG